MTVRGLIEKLQALPQDLDVEIANEGGNGSRGTEDVFENEEPWRGGTRSFVVIASGWEGL